MIAGCPETGARKKGLRDTHNPRMGEGREVQTEPRRQPKSQGEREKESFLEIVRSIPREAGGQKHQIPKKGCQENTRGNLGDLRASGPGRVTMQSQAAVS